MAGNLVKQILMSIVADPGDSHEQLDSLSGKAEELARPFSLSIVADTEEAQGSVDAVTEALARYNEAQAESDDATARFNEVSATAAAGSDEYQAALDRQTEATVRSLDAQIRLGQAELDASARSRESADVQDESAAKTDESAVAAEGLGSKLKLAALAFVAAGAIGVHMAANMDQATTRLVTSAGESQQNLAMVRQGMLQLSVSTDTSLTQLESGMYLVESAGYHGGQGLLVLKAASEGAAEEGANLGDVANAVTSALNAYHEPASKAVTVTDEMLKAVGQGKMTFSQLAGSLATILPVAAAAHLSFAQVAGGIATMTAQGTSADEATQLLRHTLVSLQNPNSVQIAEMQQLGVNSNALARNIGKEGLTGTISELEDAILHQMGPSGMVLLHSFNESKLAAQSANEEIQAMPPSLQKLARSYLDGSISVQAWQKIMFQGSLPADQKNLLEQFAGTANAAHGFNSELKAGGGDAQTFTAALSKVMGGQEGLQVALQVGGAHMSTYRANVAAVGAAARHTGSDVSDWALTQHQFNFEMGSAEKATEAAAISLGQVLMPAVLAVLHPVSDFMGWVARTSGASEALAVVLGGVLTVVLATKLVGGINSAVGAGNQLIEWGTKLAVQLGLVTAETDANTAATEAKTAATEAQTAVTEGATVAQGELDAAMDANPIGLVVIAITALIGAIVIVVTHLKDFERWGDDAFHAVEHAAEDVWNWVHGHWPLLLGILTGPVGLAVAYIGQHWHQISQGADDAVHDVESFFGRLPGDILHWTADFGHLLWNAGAALLHGLVSGIESAVGDVTHVVGGVAHDVASFFGLSPAIRGPLSAGGAPEIRGRHFAEALAMGMEAGSPSVEAAALRLAQSTMSGYSGGSTGAHGVYGRGGGGDTYIFNVAPLVNPHETAMEIQQMLLSLKRNRFGPASTRGATATGLGLS